MRNIILMMTLCFSSCLCAQEIPLPQKCFPLNGTDSEDIMSGQTADIHGAVHLPIGLGQMEKPYLLIKKIVICLFLLLRLVNRDKGS